MMPEAKDLTAYCSQLSREQFQELAGLSLPEQMSVTHQERSDTERYPSCKEIEEALAKWTETHLPCDASCAFDACVLEVTYWV
jgi:hypothetical protein